ncbi:MAG: YkgJ family cysteine cluster protein [Candidatus Aminicenantes bacterium]|nr:MAG: YkgJ family cysteine cluster protein [Candidatus Aminicenantes bacterium]
MIETNIKKIKKYCQEKKEKNWEFRRFLKTCNLGSKEIDAIVHQVYREVSSQIDCKACANCCKKASFLIEEKDIIRLARGLNLSLVEFKEKYILDCKERNGDGYTFNQLPCPFLEDNRCKVYRFRPGNCRSFPYLHKKDFVFKIINVIDNCSICPIVFNVYERLKKEIHLHISDDV